MSQDPIPMLDVRAQNAPLDSKLVATFERVLQSNRFILGPEVTALEEELAAHVGTKHAIGVSSGTDALLVAMMALDIGAGDEVITTPYTFFATGGCIARLGAKPVFVDIDPITFNLDVSKVAGAITEKTRAIMPVHLFGQSCDMRALSSVAGELPIIEDAAQSLGARCCEGAVGSLGAFGCFSFFPSKNLGGLGDGGLVTTQDDALADKARVLRAHGSKPKYFHKLVGGNFRIDALQAALLRVKFPSLDGWTAGRQKNAEHYGRLFAAAGLPATRLTTPKRVHEAHVYNQYVIRTDRRDAVMKRLQDQQIGCAIYYPRALHLQECFAELGHSEGDFPESEKASAETLAIPVFPELGEARVERIANTILDVLAD